MLKNFGTPQHLVAWIARQDPGGTFVAAAKPHCLFCQYGEAHGVGDAADPSTYARTVNHVALTPEERAAIVAEPRTFGDALRRAEAVLELEHA